MAKRRSRMVREREARRLQRRASQERPGGSSNYARKRKYLIRTGQWGFEVPEPKPWKTT